ncbi:tRNA pseudouridine(38-40) synthase TruA [Campylobacter estrildidarum]|uniref:tRNA pseudouridine synthase A n=1 Tax=Campylobacter estrildidarum TaxID=2510189 RepID=A0A4U7BI41_9BACT|nr:tRNA pseudouridine(38-40) synthase TruA [Campylobacter estrildidarum]TKX29991.1 tRNA pseudouridine(38-40) synthase TruA [Campylobacter estrildidarum]
MKLKLVFSYDGSAFLGSATQPHQRSVQDTLQKALAHLGIFSKILMASRTDKGVHATFAVACVECGEYFQDLNYLKKQLNKFAHPYIHIKYLKFMPFDFEVRYDVKSREYRYIFHHGKFNPFLSRYVYFYPQIDIKKANEILKYFIGEYDFKYFCKSGGDSKTTIRKMLKSYAYAYKNMTIFHFKANGFLRGQIRLSIASILKVLENKMSIEELKDQLGAKKQYNHILVPPNGLYLSRICY